MLISMADSDVYLYDIETADIIRKYSGKLQGQFIIRSAFGGSDENMVISGSEGMSISFVRRAGKSKKLTDSQIPKSTYGTKRTAL